MSAVFYVKYTDGRVSQFEFSANEVARSMYQLYAKFPEPNAIAYGWTIKCIPMTARQKNRSRKAGVDI